MCGTVATSCMVEMNHTDAVNIIRALMEDQGEPTLTMVTAKGATKPIPRPRIKTALVCMCVDAHVFVRVWCVRRAVDSLG